MIRALWVCVLSAGLLASCDSDFKTPDVVLVDLKIAPVTAENMNTSYHKSKPVLASSLPLIIDYSGFNAAFLHEAVAYLDANADSFIDMFFATGLNLSTIPTDAELYINAGDDLTFTDQASSFPYLVSVSDATIADVPQSLHARKSLVSDFTGDDLDDIFVLDQGVNDGSFSGAAPKLLIHQTRLTDPNDPASALIHSFRHQIYGQDAGYHTGGASADIDNDGDSDIFVGGLEPFFYINTGLGGFVRVNNRWDRSMNKVLTAELVDVDQDGYVDLIAAGNETDGDVTSIYWGNSTGAYSRDLRTSIDSYAGYESVLDIEVEDLDADSNRDIVLYRRNPVTDTDRVVQILKNNADRSFADVTATTIVNPVNTVSAWLRAQDYDNDGDIDILPDNAAAGFWYQNDGFGVFIQQ